jgi:hypothetical protein
MKIILSQLNLLHVLAGDVLNTFQYYSKESMKCMQVFLIPVFAVYARPSKKYSFEGRNYSKKNLRLYAYISSTCAFIYC